MFEIFSERALHVIVLAQEEVRRLGHTYIGTEHLLLALADDPACGAAAVLERLGLSVEATWTRVNEAVVPGDGVPHGHIPFTPSVKRSLKLAAQAATDLGHAWIGTEHLLLGLLQEGDGTAAQVLQQAGVSVEPLRDGVAYVAGGRQGDLPDTSG